jgi:mono/diheme cytochrome c family protein
MTAQPQAIIVRLFIGFAIALVTGLTSVSAHAQATAASRGQDIWRAICAGCHGATPDNRVSTRGSTLAGLNSAFASISQMSGDPFIRSLTTSDREDLVAFLRGDPITPPGPPAAVVSAFDVTDLWVTNGEGGWGLNLTHHKSGSDGVFGVLYLYASDGRPTWFTIPDGKWETTTRFKGTVFRTSGPTPATATFNSALVRAANVGTATVTFSSANAGSITYSVNGQTITKAVARLAF